MDKVLIDGKIGEVGKYEVDIKGGNLIVLASVSASPIDANVVVKVDAGIVLDAIAKAIPGKIDDALLAILKAALLAV
jgi:hypothetical protein